MNSRYFKYLLFLSVISIASCRQRARPADPLARPVERKIIGIGTDYDPIGGPGPAGELALAETLATSFKARREHGWEVFSRLMQPVPVSGRMLPVFQTWYDAGEVQEIFRVYYRMLMAESRKQEPEELKPDGVLSAAWNAYHQQGAIAPGRNQLLFDRFQNLLGQIQQDPQRAGGMNGFGSSAGVNGRGVVLFSPQLVRAYLLNYQAAIRCVEPGAGVEAKPGEPGKVAFRLRPEEPGRTAGLVSKALQRFSDDEFGACFGEPLPRGAVAIKLTWAPVGSSLRGEGASEIANYDTSPAGMAAMRAKAGTWRIADQSTSAGKPRTVPVPGADGIYRVRLDNGKEWVLTGIHATTRETKEWVWASYWWGGDEPDKDFGGDRPDLCRDKSVGLPAGESCSSRGALLNAWYAPWQKYKMCVVSAWREGDVIMNAVEPGRFAALADEAGWNSGLMAAAEATRAGYTAEKRAGDGRFYTWCSNPFIEFEAGMADSNCIGCHQFAAPGDSYIQSEHNKFDKALRDFPADFLWSFDTGVNHIAGRIHSIVRDEGN